MDIYGFSNISLLSLFFIEKQEKMQTEASAQLGTHNTSSNFSSSINLSRIRKFKYSS